MKKIYVLALAVFGAVSLNAQSVEALDWPGVVTVDELENPYEVTIDVTNTSVFDVNVRVRTEVVSIMDGTDYRFCWGPLCYEWTTGDSESFNSEGFIVTIAPQEVNNTFYTDYRHNGVEGTTIINYCWFNNNNNTDEACYELQWQLGPVGIDDVKDAAVTAVSPQPVTGLSSFSYDFQGFNSGSVEIFNLMGELVKTIDLDNPLGVVFIDADDFQSGVYFYSLVADGKKTATKRLIVAN